MKAKKQTKKQNKKLKKSVFGWKPVLLIWLILLLSPVLTYQLLYFDKISPGIFIDDFNVGGLSKKEATEMISNNIFLPGSVEFTYSDKNYSLTSAEINAGLDIPKTVEEAFNLTHSGNIVTDYAKRFEILLKTENLNVIINSDEGSINSFIDKVSSNIDKEAKNSKFNFENGKVTEFQPSEEGLKVDREKLLGQIHLSFQIIKNSAQVTKNELPVDVIKPEITTDSINNLGIKELIGQGTSTYYHSITSRVHNVVLAASRINGTLVKPGDIFSFNETLGDVSQFTGYQQAYIISEGKTILGDGGGVCQVSTTLFRALLNAGLPITDRTAHAYRVGYYEQNSPPGLDATVYGPSPDLKFVNDTPGYILIEAVSDPKHYSLTFQLYGTSDGRVATISKPVITGVSPPLPTVYQDDPTLPAGTLKQTDFAASGAKVSFKYTVTRNGETLQNKTFVSNYKSWAAVYLRGIASR